jgi:adenylate cyclase
MGKIIASTGPYRGTEYPISGPTVLGRHEESDVVLPDRRASRRHARIDLTGGKCFIQDLGSRNGTIVNDQLVTRQQLQDGDEIVICESRFVFRDAAAPIPLGQLASGSHRADELPNIMRRSMVTFKREDTEEAKPQVNAMLDADDLANLGVQGAAGDESAERARKSLRTIWKVANALVTVHDLQALLEEVMNQLFEIFPQADRGFVMLKEEGSDELQAKVIRSRGQHPEEAVEIQISSTVVREIMTKGKAVLTSDAQSDERFSDRLSIVNFQIRSMMAAPLIVRGDILGLIHIDTSDQTQSFTEQDLELLTAMGPQVAIAIRNAQLIKQVETEAERRSGLQRYLSPDLVEMIMENKLDIAVGTRWGTAFFSDIIGFTRMSEKLTPQEVVDRLNQYFHVMEEIIFRHGGTIDKFGGDSIMAFWGVLVPKEGATLEAVTAAVEMQNALFAFNLAIGGELARDPLRMGIGLNTGDLVAGPIGSDKKVEFTVIGDSVNTAQRIESKAGRTQVFISGSSYEEVAPSVGAIKLPAVEVKNKSGLVQMYSIRAVCAPGGLAGILTSLPVTYAGPSGAQTDGLIVWAKPDAGKLLIELCATEVPAVGAEVELDIRVQEKPSLQDVAGRVVAARSVQGPGSALLEVASPSKALMGLISPGSVLPADITAAQVVRE